MKLHGINNITTTTTTTTVLQPLLLLLLLLLLRAFIERKITQGPQMRYVGRNSSMVA